MPKYKVIVTDDIKPYPESFEISAAVILAKHFRTDVKFLPRRSSSTPDIEIGNVRWEIKSSTGNGKRTIQHQIHRALHQSTNIIFDSRRTKLRIDKIRTDLQKQATNKAVKRLVLVEKDEKVNVIK